MNTAESNDSMTPSQLITNHIAELADWRGPMLARLRALILDAAPGITEEWKWDHAGVCLQRQCGCYRCV